MNTDIILQTHHRAVIYLLVSHQRRNLVVHLELLGQLAVL